MVTLKTWGTDVYRQPGIQPRGRPTFASLPLRSLAIPAFWVGLLATAGCGPGRTPYPEALQSQRPQERAAAAKRAAELGDREVIGLLVDRLEDPDEAVRFYAILALEKLTGTRRGYDYRAGETDRWRAVQQWRRHLASGGESGESSPGGAGS